MIYLIPSDNINEAYKYILNEIKINEKEKLFSSFIFVTSKSQLNYLKEEINNNFKELIYFIDNIQIFTDFIKTYYFDNKELIDGSLKIQNHKILIDNNYELLILFQIIIKNQYKLKYFKNFFDKKIKYDFMANKGLLYQILDFIKLLQNNYLEDNILKKALEDDYGNKIKPLFEDFINIKDDYLNYLEENNFYTIEDIKIKIDNYLLKNSLFNNRIKYIYFIGFSYLTENEKNIINKIILKEINNKKNISIFLPDEIIDILINKKKYINKFGIFRNLFLILDDLYNKQKTEFQKVNLPDKEKKNEITIQSFPNRITELKWICNDIAKNIEQDKAFFKNTILIIPDLNKYENYIEEIFEEFNIPYYITKGKRINNFQLINLIKNFINFIFSFDENSATEFFNSLFQNAINNSEILNNYKSLFSEYYGKINNHKLELSDFQFNFNLIKKVFIKYNLNFFNLENIEKINSEIEKKTNSNEKEILEILFNIYILKNEIKKLIEYRDRLIKNPENFSIIIKQFFSYYKILEIFITNTIKLNNKKNISDNIKALNIFLQELENMNLFLTDFFQSKNENNLFEKIIYIIDLIISNLYIHSNLTNNSLRISEALEIRNITYKNIYFIGLTAEDFPSAEARYNLFLEEPIDYYKYNILNKRNEAEIIFNNIIKNFDRLILTYPEFENEAQKQISPILEEFIKKENIKIEQIKNCEFKYSNKYKLLQTAEKINKYFSGEKIESLSFPDNNIYINLVNYYEYFIRKNFENENEFCGKIINNRIKNYYNNYINNFSFSQSALNILVNCPFSFFFKYLLNLKEDKIIEIFDIINNEIGNLIHYILKEYFNNNIRNSNISEIKKDHYNELKNLLVKTTNEKFLNNEIKEIMKFLLIKYIQINDCILKKFLDYEKKEMSKFINISNEYQFKTSINLDKNEEIIINVNGLIDRIDISENNEEINIIDYKTNRKENLSKEKKILQGDDYQLPLYYLAIKAYDEFSKIKKINCGYYLLNSLNNVSFDKVLIFDNLIESKFYELCILNNLKEIKKYLKNGFFSQIDECDNYCEFQNICYKNLNSEKKEIINKYEFDLIYDKINKILKLYKELKKYENKNLKDKRLQNAFKKRYEKLKEEVKEYLENEKIYINEEIKNELENAIKKFENYV
ncbi:MAG TPA: PD-(D/E)XK nuclease family protein [bacterium]|nr:PD-(D/E)XK nuclease family protein [bacterium]HPQ19984.1 PD-(D/E)XK nuclease family protein [bacterium]